MTRAPLITSIILTLLMVAGFWFHTSAANITILGKYDTRYFLILGCLTAATFVGWMCLLKLLITRQVTFPSGRRIALSVSFKVAVILAFAISGLLMMESILWARAHPALQARETKLASYHPFLQIVNPPNDKIRHTNRWGFRSEEIELKKPPGAFRIFVVGGSTVFCGDVDYEQTHCRVLQRKLEQYDQEATFEVQNAGCPWHASLHSLLKLQSTIEDFDPDLIILYHAVNDLYRGFAPEKFSIREYQSDYGHYYGPLGAFVDAYRTGSQPSFFCFQHVSRVFKECWFTDLRDRKPAQLREIRIRQWPSLPAFRRNMRNIVKYAQASDIRLVLASQPFLYRSDLEEEELAAIVFPKMFCEVEHRIPDLASMIDGMTQFNAAIREIAGEANIPFVDLASAVPKTLENFSDDVHCTPAGNQIIGETLAAELISRNLIPSRNKRGADHSLIE